MAESTEWGYLCSFLGSGARACAAGVYDRLGHIVRRLLDRSLPAGTHEVAWDGRSDADVQLPAGVYLLRLEAGGRTHTQKIIITR